MIDLEDLFKNCSSNYEKVQEFHKTYGMPLKTIPRLISKKRAQLRIDLIGEEFEELMEGIAKDDLVEIADALIDLLYVTYGACCEYGIDADIGLTEVHDSNMSKLDENGNPIYREDGKVLKGPNFREPNLAKVLNICE